jgi:hypothetical protein
MEESSGPDPQTHRWVLSVFKTAPVRLSGLLSSLAEDGGPDPQTLSGSIRFRSGAGLLPGSSSMMVTRATKNPVSACFRVRKVSMCLQFIAHANSFDREARTSWN